MCEYQPALKTKQFVVKAILAAGMRRDSVKKYVTTHPHFHMYGAGLLDASAALYAIFAGDYSRATGSLTEVGSSKTYTMEVTSSDTLMRVALAYGNRIEYNSDEGTHDPDSVPYSLIASLDLEVFDPNGNLVKAVHLTNTKTSFGVAWR